MGSQWSPELGPDEEMAEKIREVAQWFNENHWKIPLQVKTRSPGEMPSMLLWVADNLANEVEERDSWFEVIDEDRLLWDEWKSFIEWRKNRFDRFTEEQITRICYTVEKWMMIKDKYEFDEGRERCFNPFDASHSSLLPRLLEGTDPLPYPPPKSFSYPDYDMVEKDYAKDVEFLLYENREEAAINQCRGWKVIERDEENDITIVEWPPSGMLFKVEPHPEEQRYFRYKMIRIGEEDG